MRAPRPSAPVEGFPGGPSLAEFAASADEWECFMVDRLKIVIASFLDIDPASVGDDASPETIPSWDSVKQIELMLGVEDEFKIRFTDDEVSNLVSYAAIRDALLSRGQTLA
jgi:acyl carrier protein